VTQSVDHTGAQLTPIAGGIGLAAVDARDVTCAQVDEWFAAVLDWNAGDPGIGHQHDHIHTVQFVAPPGFTVQRLYDFYHWCAQADIDELKILASTVETWWPAIEAFSDTGIANARTGGLKITARSELKGRQRQGGDHDDCDPVRARNESSPSSG